MVKQSYIICGIHAVRHTLNKAAHKVMGIWVQGNKKSAQALSEILLTVNDKRIPVQYVTAKTLDKITHQANHQGIAIRRQAESSNAVTLDKFLTGDIKNLLLLVLDSVQDPHNLGACLRTADAAGGHAIIVPKDRAARLNETVFKVASGAAENIPVIYVTNLSRCLQTIQNAGVWIIGADEKADNTIYEEDLTVPLALVLGSEGQGLRQNTRRYCDKLVQIPMAGIVESLNVSIAATICLYEARRQRHYSLR